VGRRALAHVGQAVHGLLMAERTPAPLLGVSFADRFFFFVIILLPSLLKNNFPHLRCDIDPSDLFDKAKIRAKVFLYHTPYHSIQGKEWKSSENRGAAKFVHWRVFVDDYLILQEKF
jgi:hypothetical protein